MSQLHDVHISKNVIHLSTSTVHMWRTEDWKSGVGGVATISEPVRMREPPHRPNQIHERRRRGNITKKSSDQLASIGAPQFVDLFGAPVRHCTVVAAHTNLTQALNCIFRFGVQASLVYTGFVVALHSIKKTLRIVCYRMLRAVYLWFRRFNRLSLERFVCGIKYCSVRIENIF